MQKMAWPMAWCLLMVGCGSDDPNNSDTLGDTESLSAPLAVESGGSEIEHWEVRSRILEGAPTHLQIEGWRAGAIAYRTEIAIVREADEPSALGTLRFTTADGREVDDALNRELRSSMLDDLNALRSLQAEPSARQSVASTKSTCDDQPLPPIFANCLPEFREVILECRDLATEALNYGLAIAVALSAGQLPPPPPPGLIVRLITSPECAVAIAAFGACVARQTGAIPSEVCPDESDPVITDDGGACLPEDCSFGCPGGAEAGGDTPFSGSFELGQDSGTFNFSREHFSIQDRVTVTYEGKTLYDSGCTGGTDSVAIPYSGDLTKVVVEVEPNCAGTTGTAWNFSVSCPQ